MNAELFLKVHLSEVSLDLESLRTLAEEFDISWSAIKRAKQKLRVRSVKRGFPAKVVAWRLPRYRYPTLEERIQYAEGEQRALKLRLKQTERALADLRRLPPSGRVDPF